MLVLCNFLRKLMVSDKRIHRAFRTPTALFIKQNPLLRQNFYFHHLTKLYIGFKSNVLPKHCKYVCNAREHNLSQGVKIKVK